MVVSDYGLRPNPTYPTYPIHAGVGARQHGWPNRRSTRLFLVRQPQEVIQDMKMILEKLFLHRRQ